MLFDRGYAVFWEDKQTYMNTCLRKWYHFLYVRLPWELDMRNARLRPLHYNTVDLLSRARQEYDDKKRVAKYWNKIERQIRRKCLNDVQLFVMSFKHDSFGSLICDDEFRIMALADYYGYSIVDESLTTKDSTYTFQKK